MKQSPEELKSKLVPDDFASFHFHLLVKPLPVAAAFNPALTGVTFRTGVEAAHTVHIQTVAHVLPVGQQTAFAVVHSAFGSSSKLPV